MKRYRFRFLFVLMCLALGSGIALQAYWLKHAVSIEREKFDRDVHTALTQAATQLETDLTRDMIWKAMDQDHLKFNFKLSHTPDTGLQQIRIVGPPPDTTFRKTVMPAPGTQVQAFRITSVHRDSASLLPPPARIEMFLSDKDTVLQPGLPPGAQHRNNVFRSAVNDAFVQYVIQGMTPSDMVQKKDVEKAVNAALSARGIDLKYDYAMIGRRTPDKEIISDRQQRTALAASAYRVPVFPDAPFGKTEFLAVQFASPGSFIARSLWPQFLLSFFVTAALVTVFFLTFREMLRQKKLSDIRNDFISNMTHEFKTPIATISLAADTAMNEAVIHSPEKVKHYLELVKQENRRMNEQVEKVLQAALAERGELRLQREACDIVSVIRRAADSFRLQVEARGGELQLDLPAALLFTGDAFHLEKAVANLIDNAVKYSPGPPHIAVSAKKDAGQISIAVSDRGIGIRREDQQRIFDKFYRVSTGNLHDVKGFGLGLNYVRSVVAAHKGTVQLSSTPGKGSVFTIQFDYGD